MVKYTKAAIDLTLKDLRLFYNIFKYTFMLLTAGYFAYAIATGLGNLVVNIILWRYWWNYQSIMQCYTGKGFGANGLNKKKLNNKIISYIKI